MLKDDSFRTGTSDSRIYDCGIERAMADHFLLRCSRYSEARSVMKNYIYEMCFSDKKRHMKLTDSVLLAHAWDALRTLRPQVTSAPRHFGTYIWCRSVPDTSAPVPKWLKTLWEGAAGQQQVNRTQTCPCGPTCPGPRPAASPYYSIDSINCFL